MTRTKKWAAKAAVASAILVLVSCGASDESANGWVQPDPPEIYSPGVDGPPSCELSVDCPEGTYCDLGECFQVCNVEDSCAGTSDYCSERGRCQEEDVPDSDPVPEVKNAAELRTSDAEIFIAGDESMIALELFAAPTDIDIRYRIEAQVPWLQVSEARGEFSGALVETLTVDRTGLAAGQHTGTVLIVTSVGIATYTVVLDMGIGGTYQGAMNLSAPFVPNETPAIVHRLGSVPFAISVDDSEGELHVAIDAGESLLFPDATESELSVVATPTANEGEFTASFVQTFEPADLASERLVEQRLIRNLEVTFAPSASGGLEGSFVDSWQGVLEETIYVNGTLALARTGSAAPISLSAPATLPAEAVVRPTIESACTSAARVAAGLPFGSCTSNSSALEKFSCGNALLEVGNRLDDPSNGLLVGTPGRNYGDFAVSCTADLNSSASVSATPPDCLRRANIECAQAFFHASSSLGESQDKVGETAAAHAGLGTLLLNEALVRAFELPYKGGSTLGPSALEGQMLVELDDARTQARQSLQYAFDPAVLQAMAETPSFVARASSNQSLRRLALFVSRYRSTMEEWFRTKVRSQGLSTQDKDNLRARTQVDALVHLTQLAALSAIEEAQGAVGSAELGLFDEALTRLGRQFSLFDGSRDVLGIPEGQVVFVYDHLNAGSRGNTNFEQVLASKTGPFGVLGAALTAEAEAEAATRAFDVNVDAMESELSELAIVSDSRLAALCGNDYIGNGNAECTGGAMSSAFRDMEVQEQQVNIARTRILSHEERIEALEDRIEAIESIRGNSLEFITSTNEKLDRIRRKQRRRSRWRKALSVASAAAAGTAVIVATGGSAAPLVIGAAAGIADGLLSDSQEGLANNRDKLLEDQQLQLTAADYAVESIQLAGQLKELEIQSSQITEELILATMGLLTGTVRIQNLQEEVIRVGQEQDLRIARVSGSLANDPMFRVLRNQAVAEAVEKKERALEGIYQAARAFEFEINSPFSAIESDLVPAKRASDIEDLVVCMNNQWGVFRETFSSPQTFTDEISLREDVFGITGEKTDEVTGQTLSAAEQFRQRLLNPQNRTTSGGVSLRFATSVSPGNGLWSSGVCNDQIASISVKILGNGLGDDQARVRLTQGQALLMRSCEAVRNDDANDIIQHYQLPESESNEVSAGINSYPADSDFQFFGRPVGASEWVLELPSGNETPTNSDIDVTQIEDIVLSVNHRAISLGVSPRPFTPNCN